MILVSACLVGCPCKYSGGDNFSPAVQAFLKDKDYILCCPEQLGGLPTPRACAEIQKDGRVLTSDGRDVTDYLPTRCCSITMVTWSPCNTSPKSRDR